MPRYTHIDNDSSDKWFHPVCGHTWDTDEPVETHDYTVFLPTYARGEAKKGPDTEWCPACLNHPKLPIYVLKCTELEDE